MVIQGTKWPGLGDGSIKEGMGELTGATQGCGASKGRERGQNGRNSGLEKGDLQFEFSVIKAVEQVTGSHE